MTPPPRSLDVSDLGTTLLELGEVHPELAASLSRAFGVVVREVHRNPRFAHALEKALRGESGDTPISATRRPGRRAPGVLDPFAVYADEGEDVLRAKLRELNLEQLRDIVAQHAMDHDRLAMKWKTPDRVIDRILEKVQTRSTKGSAFR